MKRAVLTTLLIVLGSVGVATAEPWDYGSQEDNSDNLAGVSLDFSSSTLLVGSTVRMGMEFAPILGTPRDPETRLEVNYLFNFYFGDAATQVELNEFRLVQGNAQGCDRYSVYPSYSSWNGILSFSVTRDEIYPFDPATCRIEGDLSLLETSSLQDGQLTINGASFNALVKENGVVTLGIGESFEDRLAGSSATLMVTSSAGDANLISENRVRLITEDVSADCAVTPADPNASRMLPGACLEYEVWVSNDPSASAAAESISIIVPIPAQLTYVSSDIGTFDDLSVHLGNLEGTISALQPGQSASFTYRVRIP